MVSRLEAARHASTDTALCLLRLQVLCQVEALSSSAAAGCRKPSACQCPRKSASEKIFSKHLRSGQACTAGSQPG